MNFFKKIWESLKWFLSSEETILKQFKDIEQKTIENTEKAKEEVKAKASYTKTRLNALTKAELHVLADDLHIALKDINLKKQEIIDAILKGNK